jgi:hypothetical protein
MPFEVVLNQRYFHCFTVIPQSWNDFLLSSEFSAIQMKSDNRTLAIVLRSHAPVENKSIRMLTFNLILKCARNNDFTYNLNAYLVPGHQLPAIQGAYLKPHLQHTASWKIC